MFPVIYTQVVTLLGVLAAGSGGGGHDTRGRGRGREWGEGPPGCVWGGDGERGCLTWLGAGGRGGVCVYEWVCELKQVSGQQGVGTTRA